MPLWTRHRSPAASVDGSIYVVAILKYEERFIEEWIAYHRIIGVDRFLLYDDDPRLPLRALLEHHAAYVTVVDWAGRQGTLPGHTSQTEAYTHALGLLPPACRWVAFIDGDEFIVLRKHASLQSYLSRFEKLQVGSVLLSWHVFGHNGYFDDPQGLVTASLVRRMAAPSIRTKAIARPEAIASIPSPHRCQLKPGWFRADANGVPGFGVRLRYPGKTSVAHINHYMCRSFRQWMRRVDRGDVSFDAASVPDEHRWRLDQELCLKQFVETIAKDKNELVDRYMLRYEKAIQRSIVEATSRSPSSRAISAKR